MIQGDSREAPQRHETGFAALRKNSACVPHSGTGTGTNNFLLYDHSIPTHEYYLSLTRPLATWLVVCARLRR